MQQKRPKNLKNLYIDEKRGNCLESGRSHDCFGMFGQIVKYWFQISHFMIF